MSAYLFTDMEMLTGDNLAPDDIVMEIYPIYNIRRYIYLKCLTDGAPLIGRTYDGTFDVPGRDQRKREHVLSDDVLFYIVKIEIPVGVPKCPAGMRKTVKPVVFVLLMPVIEEIIVEERSSYKALPVDFLMKDLLDRSGDKERELGNRNGMLEYGGRPVLGKLLHLLSLISKYEVSAVCKDLFRDLVFGYRITQVRNLFSFSPYIQFR